MDCQDLGRCLSFIVGCLGMMLAGCIFAVPIYTNAVKEKFDYDQWIVELMVALCNFGYYFLIPAGFVFERAGPSWTSLICLLLAGTGYMMQWSTTFYIKYYSKMGELQALFHFLIGFGYGFINIAVVMANVENFSQQHRGKAMAFIYVAFNAGTMSNSWLYAIAFARGYLEDEGNQDLRGYYLSDAVVVFVVCILCSLFLRSYPVNTELTCLIVDDTQMNRVQEVTGYQLFKLCDFQYFLWGSILSGCIQLVFLNNTGTFLKSFNFEEYTVLFVTTFSVSQIVSKVISGFLSDSFIEHFPRTTPILVLNVIQTILLILSIFLSDNFTILLLTYITIGLADGCLWWTLATTLREYYGMKYFARNFGVYSTIISVSAIGSNVLFGCMYQMAIPYENQKDCYGRECYIMIFTFNSVMSFISVVLYVGVYKNHSK